MTLAEIRASTKPCLTSGDIAPVLGCHRYNINLSAKDGSLPFPFFWSGNRLKVPRMAFLRWFDGRGGETQCANAQ